MRSTGAQATVSSPGTSPEASTSSTDAAEPGARRPEEFIELARRLPGLNAGDVPSYELAQREARASVVLSGTVSTVEPDASSLAPEGLEGTVDLRSVIIELSVDTAYVGPAGGGDASAAPIENRVTFSIDSVTPYNADDIDRMEAQLLDAAPIGARAVLYLEPHGAAPRALFLEGSDGTTITLDPLLRLPPFEELLRRISALEPLPTG